MAEARKQHRATLTERDQWIQEEEDFSIRKNFNVILFLYKDVFVRTCDHKYKI